MLTGKKKQTNRNPITPSNTVAFGSLSWDLYPSLNLQTQCSLHFPLLFRSATKSSPLPHLETGNNGMQDIPCSFTRIE